MGAARFSARAAGKPAQPQAQDRNVPAGEDRHGNYNEGT